MEIQPIFHAPPHPIQEPASKRQKTLLDPKNDHATLNDAMFRHLLKKEKLSLVLDLDNTLLHSAMFENLTLQEQDLILNQTHDSKVFGTVVSNVSLVTKLRPGLAHFLEEASKLFCLHVFTKGSFAYAMKMLDLIDPGRVYFETVSRIFARENCTHPNKQKTLDVVVGEPRGILIVDDLESVWEEKDRKNVVVIPGYQFFGHSSKRGAGGEGGKSSQLVMGSDESETEGHLSSVLVFLKRIHEMFFETETELQVGDRDVRKLKADLCQELLNGSAETDEEEEICIIL